MNSDERLEKGKDLSGDIVLDIKSKWLLPGESDGQPGDTGDTPRDEGAQDSTALVKVFPIWTRAHLENC